MKIDNYCPISIRNAVERKMTMDMSFLAKICFNLDLIDTLREYTIDKCATKRYTTPGDINSDVDRAQTCHLKIYKTRRIFVSDQEILPSDQEIYEIKYNRIWYF